MKTKSILAVVMAALLGASGAWAGTVLVTFDTEASQPGPLSEITNGTSSITYNSGVAEMNVVGALPFPSLNTAALSFVPGTAIAGEYSVQFTLKDVTPVVTSPFSFVAIGVGTSKYGLLQSGAVGNIISVRTNDYVTPFFADVALDPTATSVTFKITRDAADLITWSYAYDDSETFTTFSTFTLGGAQPGFSFLAEGYELGAGAFPETFPIDDIIITAPEIADFGLDLDGDGLDYFEELDLGTDPNSNDSDEDGLLDGWEVQWGLDPNDGTGDNGANGDPDQDFIPNWQEQEVGGDPFFQAMPALSVVGLGLLTGACAIAGALISRRKK